MPVSPLELTLTKSGVWKSNRITLLQRRVGGGKYRLLDALAMDLHRRRSARDSSWEFPTTAPRSSNGFSCGPATPQKSPHSVNDPSVSPQQQHCDSVQRDSQPKVLSQRLVYLLVQVGVRYWCPIVRFRKNASHLPIDCVLPLDGEKSSAR